MASSKRGWDRDVSDTCAENSHAAANVLRRPKAVEIAAERLGAYS